MRMTREQVASIEITFNEQVERLGFRIGDFISAGVEAFSKLYRILEIHGLVARVEPALPHLSRGYRRHIRRRKAAIRRKM